MCPAANVQRTHRGPASVGSTLWIEDKRTIGSIGRAEAAGDQHFAVGKQSGGVTGQTQRQRCGWRPCAGAGIEQLRAVEDGAIRSEPCDDQNLSTLQSYGSMFGAARVHWTGWGEVAGGGFVQFRASRGAG